MRLMFTWVLGRCVASTVFLVPRNRAFPEGAERVSLWRNRFWQSLEEGAGKRCSEVYDILPPATAIVDYITGLEKLPANEQFFDDAQTAVSL